MSDQALHTTHTRCSFLVMTTSPPPSTTLRSLTSVHFLFSVLLRCTSLILRNEENGASPSFTAASLKASATTHSSSIQVVPRSRPLLAFPSQWLTRSTSVLFPALHLSGSSLVLAGSAPALLPLHHPPSKSSSSPPLSPALFLFIRRSTSSSLLSPPAPSTRGVLVVACEVQSASAVVVELSNQGAMRSFVVRRSASEAQCSMILRR
jgi:hypothetical protein